MRAAPGSYAIILRNHADKTIRVGRRLQLDIQPGFYLYVGSAFGPGGLRARVGRHAGTVKKHRWHIDFIREQMQFQCAWYSYAPFNQEHLWAARLTALPNFTPLAGIGCSDCNCATHLFYTASRPDHGLFNRCSDEPVYHWRKEAAN